MPNYTATHRGYPPRKKAPAPGTLRYLTQRESEVTGLTRNCLLLNDQGRLRVFAPTGTAYATLTEVTDAVVLEDLHTFWEFKRS